MENKEKSLNYAVSGVVFEAMALKPGLYLVPTPIGNLKDITLRALETLAAADVIFCEDTRHTRKLLTHFVIKTRLQSYHDHSSPKQRANIIKQLQLGKSVALVSDAGMPLISDPGVKLVQQVIEAGLPLVALPGPSATLTALAVSGLARERFLFAGFVPTKKSQRAKFLAGLATQSATLVLFESARRLMACLEAMQVYFSNCEIAIARELTKIHEEVIRGSLEEIIEQLAKRETLKGEIVIVINPANSGPSTSLDDIMSELEILLRDHSVRDAADILTNTSGLPRREIYAQALKLSKKDQEIS